MSEGGGRDRCGHHLTMNLNEVQLSALPPGSLFSKPPPLSHHLSCPPSAHLFISPPILSHSGSLSGFFLLDVSLFHLLQTFDLPLSLSRLYSTLSLFHPFIFNISLCGINKNTTSVLESQFYHSPLALIPPSPLALLVLFLDVCDVSSVCFFKMKI